MVKQPRRVRAEHSGGKGTVVVFAGECLSASGASARRARCVALALADDSWNVVVHTVLFRPRIHRKNGILHKGVLFCYSAFYAEDIPSRRLVEPALKLLALGRFVFDILLYSTVKRPQLVYIYDSNPIARRLMALFRFANIPIVKEYCEWYPCLPSVPMSQRHYWSEEVFGKIDGVLAISENITERIRLALGSVGPLPILKVPILYEQAFRSAGERRTASFFWCGEIDGYLDLVAYMIESLALLRHNGSTIPELQLFGRYSNTSASTIRQQAERVGVGPQVALRGFVPDVVLQSEMGAATALLLPLLDDTRSRARFPTKLAEYLSSGVPVVATRVGELTAYLTHQESALLAEPGNHDAFAECMTYVLEHANEAWKIGLNGKRIAEKNFLYKVHSRRISQFFSDVALRGCDQGHRDRSRREPASVR